MRRPTPIAKETPFEISEVFFSRTDKKGVIRSYNQTFVKISEYQGEELSGSPHNIIRHPDTPRAVFKLLWDTIQSDRPIGAYVKNMSQSGTYYWVFALALPIDSGYISFRLKPSSAIFQKIPALYATLLEAEKTGGMDKSAAVLTAALKDLGYGSYPAFMTEALNAELQGRDAALGWTKSTGAAGAASMAANAEDRAQSSARHAFHELNSAAKQVIEIRDQARIIIQSFSELNKLSINMAAASEQAGAAGHALSQVTIGFADVAREIQRQIKGFEGKVSNLIESLAESQFDLGCSRLQTEMISSFMKEASEQETGVSRQDDLKTLLMITNSSVERALSRVNSLRQLFESFIRTTDELLKTVNGLELIRITGKIEVAKLGGEHGAAFQTHIDQMANFLKTISAPMRLSSGASIVGFESTRMSVEALGILQRHLADVKAPQGKAAGALPQAI